MKVSFKKLWVLCAEKEMSKAELRKRAGLSSATFTRLRKNEEVNLSVILKIADVLDCNAGDMMDFIKEDLSAQEDIGGIHMANCKNRNKSFNGALGTLGGLF